MRIEPCVLVTLATMALTACSTAQAPASEILFVGELRSLTMTRPDREIDWEGEIIIVSNSCGMATTQFRVIRSTRPLPREVETTYELGEWCEPPVLFGSGHWLVVVSPDTHELLASYQVVFQEGAAYALLLDMQVEIARRSPETQAMLGLTPLPEPIPYRTEGSVPGGALADWVSRHPALELRDGQARIVRAVPLARIFPDLTEEALDP